MAQALMKRAIGGIPIVTFIQKESPGMNKLYAQSMCSVSQWRAYQNAEAVVSTEVDEVRSEADEIEPGWSQVRQSFGIHAFSHIYIFSFLQGRKISSVAHFFVLQLFGFYFRSYGDKPCNITTC